MDRRSLSKCPFCKQIKPNVHWNFAGNIGCKDCADRYFKDVLNLTRTE